MAVAALERQIDTMDRRVTDLRDEFRRDHASAMAEITRERDRVDDVFDAQLKLSVDHAKLQTTLKIGGTIVTLLTPMLVALGVWLVMRSYDLRTAPAPAPAVASVNVPASAIRAVLFPWLNPTP